MQAPRTRAKPGGAFAEPPYGVRHLRALGSTRAAPRAVTTRREYVRSRSRSGCGEHARRGRRHRRGAGDAAPGVLAWAAKLKPDLIVMGSHGESGAAKLLIGSVVQKVLYWATIPVLVVR